MIRTIARRTTVTLAMAGVAAFGAVALAPAASAASPSYDGPYVVVDGVGNGNGPVEFLVTDRGRMPVFFCDDEKPRKRHNICVPDPAAGGARF